MNTEFFIRYMIAFLSGAVIALTLLLLIAKANTEPCLKCGHKCSDAAIYCSNCGQQLKVTKVE